MLNTRHVKRFTRRYFIKSGSCLLLMSSFPGWLPIGFVGSKGSVGKIRVRPVEPSDLTAAQVLFCRRAHFRTAADAVRVCGRRGLEVEIYRA